MSSSSDESRHYSSAISRTPTRAFDTPPTRQNGVSDDPSSKTKFARARSLSKESTGKKGRNSGVSTGSTLSKSPIFPPVYQKRSSESKQSKIGLGDSEADDDDSGAPSSVTGDVSRAIDGALEGQMNSLLPAHPLTYSLTHSHTIKSHSLTMQFLFQSFLSLTHSRIHLPSH